MTDSPNVKKLFEAYNVAINALRDIEGAPDEISHQVEICVKDLNRLVMLRDVNIAVDQIEDGEVMIRRGMRTLVELGRAERIPDRIRANSPLDKIVILPSDPYLLDTNSEDSESELEEQKRDLSVADQVLPFDPYRSPQKEMQRSTRWSEPVAGESEPDPFRRQ